MQCTPASHEEAKRIAFAAYAAQSRPTTNEVAQSLYDTAQPWPGLPSGRQLVTGQCLRCCSTLAISSRWGVAEYTLSHDISALQLEVQALRGVVSRLLGNLPFGFDPCVYNECGDLLIYGIKAPASDAGGAQ